MSPHIPEPGRWLAELSVDGTLVVLRVEDDDTVGADRTPVPGINAALDQATKTLV